MVGPKRRIAVLGLGGTIAMSAGPGGLTPALTVAQILLTAGDLLSAVDVVAEDVLAIPSANIGFDHLLLVAVRIDALYREGFDGVVVVQGTDTLEETAFATELLVAGELPVVFTGAMRGASQPGADGPANLIAAVRVAATIPPPVGVLIVLNDEVHAARYVAKTHTTALGAFSSGDFGPVGRLHEGVFRKPHRDLRPLERLSIGEPAAAVKVALLSIGLGADPDILSSLPGFGYNGCVLEAMGAGHVPEDCVPAIAALAAQMPVVLCTRARNGRICERTYGYPGSETDLIARGVLPGGALSGPKARVALLLCLMASAEGAGAAFTRLADAI